MNPDNLKK